MKWAIVTGEFPPQPGGVGDYTQLLSQQLVSAGDEVHVWAPFCKDESIGQRNITIHRLAGRFGLRDLNRMGREIDSLTPPYRILVQYVPHAFGWKAMNLPFCWWLSRRRAPVWVMFHEVVFPLRRKQPLSHQLLGLATRVMARLVIRASEKIFVSTPAWNRFIEQCGGGSTTPIWLPVPSNIETDIEPQAITSLRRELANGEGPILGHFGTYNQHICLRLLPIVIGLLTTDARRRFVLLGRKGKSFAAQVLATAPSLRQQIIAPGGLSSSDLGVYLAACDVVLQPYPDGITTRRSSSMASLALGVPVITNLGPLSESLWEESAVVVLAKDYSSEAFIEAAESLLRCPERMTSLSTRARSLYNRRFSVQRTLETIKKCSLGPSL